MAVVDVTSGDSNTNRINAGTRVAVRTSAGTPYVLVHHATSNDLRIYKGNGTTPTSFTGQDTSNEPTVSTTNVGVAAAAIDSSDIVHTVTFFNSGKNSVVRYATFDTSSDTWGTSSSIYDVGGDSAVSPFVGITIDSNDIPHIVWVDSVANMGTDYDTVYYGNRIGGSWNTAVQVRGASASVNADTPSIAIDADNIPFIALNDDGPSTRILEGDANNATSFTNFTSTTNGSITTSVAVDSSGNHYMVSELSSPSNLRIHKHNYGDAWTSWQTAQTIASSTTNPNVSLVIDDTDLYVFVEDGSTSDIGYYKSTNYTTWDSLVTLETGTYNSVKTKWGFWVDNDSDGPLDLAHGLVGGGDGAMTGLDPQISLAQAFQIDSATDVTNVDLWVRKSGTPTDNFEVSIRSSLDGSVIGSTGSIAGSSITTSYAKYNFDVGTNSLSAATTYYLQVERSGSGDGSNYFLVETGTNSYSGGNSWRRATAGWVEQSSTDFRFIIEPRTRNELDYVFADETATPDIFWNTLSLGAPEPTTHGEGYIIITS